MTDWEKEYLLEQLKDSECVNLELGLDNHKLKRECEALKKLLRDCESFLKRNGDDNIFDWDSADYARLLQQIRDVKKEYGLIV